ncbi:EamA family transporter [Dehalogenimonas etheniformans]|uniref:EamA family transporter n=1 Tax=Dehalogenimonas etheniformans TaxID=1536648 RepID=A0A2P5P603_9CHLR|nr:DMT family transporter [Dehalogenimonas etheniformans]PPD57715.1 EamA family transporter [Dehalogenimonas etheniformans]
MVNNWKSSSGLALWALVSVTAAWGATFIVVQEAVSRMPVMDFLAVRFCLAALVMIAIRPQSLRGMGSLGFKRAAILGLALGLGYITQTFGLQHASVAVSGFITGMFVVLTPVVSWLLLKRKLSAKCLVGGRARHRRSRSPLVEWLVHWNRGTANIAMRHFLCLPHCGVGRMVVET